MTRCRALPWRIKAWLAGILALAAAQPVSAALPPLPHCLAQAPQAHRLHGVPTGRRAELARGVNITDLFAPDGHPDLPDRFRRLRAAGIRHIRVPVAPATFSVPAPFWQAAVLRRLDQAVCDAIAQHLAVVIDLHPLHPLGPPGESLHATTQRLAQVWRQLAGRYSGAPADKLFFEILNEPKLTDAQAWAQMQQSLLQAIRAVAPGNTVIATASPWSTAAALADLTPLKDRNVVYAFHFYTPMIFTHQGASWALPDYHSIRGLAFPAQPANVAQVRQDAAPDLLPQLADYATRFHTPAPIGREVQQASAWAARAHASVVVTEFGVYRDGAPSASRAAWLAAVRRTLEAHGIGWTVWEYQGGFGIADDARHGCPITADIAAALGLCVP